MLVKHVTFVLHCTRQCAPVTIASKQLSCNIVHIVMTSLFMKTQTSYCFIITYIVMKIKIILVKWTGVQAD